jgi:8-oxo-dGTP pyrophosphatase MutT (NUDIX family)
MLELLRSLGDPFSRDHFDPGHFTASAFVLSPGADELLMILHGRLHKWLQPGGHVEPDDASLLDSARREVAEETGLAETTLGEAGAAIFDIDVHPIPAKKNEPAHHHFDVRFLLRATTSEVTLGNEVRDVRWMPLERVPELQTDESVLRAVARLPRGGARRPRLNHG